MTTTIKLNKNMLFHLNWFDLYVCVCFSFFVYFALFYFALNFILNGRILSFHTIKQFSIWIWIWIELRSCCCFFSVWGQLTILLHETNYVATKYIYIEIYRLNSTTKWYWLHQCQFVNIKLNLSRHIHHHKTF